MELFSINLGLERVTALARAAGDPQSQLKFIHLAGTNGKGSCAAMLEKALRRCGFKTGLYTSPHLINIRERFRVNGCAVSEPEFEEETALLFEHPEAQACSYFEFTTILALRLFLRNKCDIIIWETGLGGRLDATNIVVPECSVITGIALDHEQYLGDTVSKTAFEKGGIIKPNVPVFSGVMPFEAQQVLREIASSRQAEFFTVEEPEVPEMLNCGIAEGRYFQSFRWQGNEYRLNLAGAMQRRNFVLVYKVLAYLSGKYGFDLSCAVSGALCCFWPGRLEEISPGIWLDGGHNPDGISQLVKSLRELSADRYTVIYAAFQDKCASPALELLAEIGCRMIFLDRQISNRSCYTPEELQKMTRLPSQSAGTLADALAAAQSYGSPILICGSLYLAGEVLAHFGKTRSVLDLE